MSAPAPAAPKVDASFVSKTIDTVTKPLSFIPGGKPVQLVVLVLLLLVAFKLATGKLPFGLDEMCKKLPVIGELCMTPEEKAAHEAAEAAPQQ